MSNFNASRSWFSFYPSTSTGYTNSIRDTELFLDIVFELMRYGRITINYTIGSVEIEHTVEAFAFPDITHPIFDLIAGCTFAITQYADSDEDTETALSRLTRNYDTTVGYGELVTMKEERNLAKIRENRQELDF